jgi:hypothetical protein
MKIFVAASIVAFAAVGILTAAQNPGESVLVKKPLGSTEQRPQAALRF